MVDFAPTSLFKQQEEVYKLVYAPAILPRGVRVDGEYIAGQTEVGPPQMTLKKWYIFSSKVSLIQLLRYNSVRTYLLVNLVKVVCPTKIFLSDFFYSGALLVH